MNTPVDPIELLPDGVNFRGVLAGDTIPYTIEWPADVTGSAHRILISDSPTGVASTVLTETDGITVGAFTDGVTPLTVLVPASATLPGLSLWWQYKLDGETQMRGTYEVAGGITEAP